MDRAWEIGATVAAGIALAFFLAYHKGKETGTTVAAQQQNTPPRPPKFPTLGQIVRDDAFQASNYDPNADYGGNAFNLDYTGPVYNLVNNVNNVTYNFPDALLVPLNNETVVNNIVVSSLGDVVTRPTYNVTSGTPQCGSCSSPDVSDLNAIIKAEHDKFNDILAALKTIRPVEPATNVYVTWTSHAPPPPTFTTNAENYYTTTDASGTQTRHNTGYYS